MLVDVDEIIFRRFQFLSKFFVKVFYDHGIEATRQLAVEDKVATVTTAVEINLCVLPAGHIQRQLP